MNDEERGRERPEYGDTNLDRSQKCRRIFAKLEGEARANASGLRQLPQSGRANRDQGNFRCRKVAVEEDQQEDDTGFNPVQAAHLF